MYICTSIYIHIYLWTPFLQKIGNTFPDRSLNLPSITCLPTKRPRWHSSWKNRTGCHRTLIVVGRSFFNTPPYCLGKDPVGPEVTNYFPIVVSDYINVSTIVVYVWYMGLLDVLRSCFICRILFSKSHQWMS